MSKIRIDLSATIINGQSLTFKAPADCSQITGLVVYYPEGDTTATKNFKFVDAHGVDVGSGIISLFAKNALVKVVLETDTGKAYIQNADTNDYLEDKFEELKQLIDAKIVCGTEEVSDGDASPYPEGTLYIVIE